MWHILLERGTDVLVGSYVENRTWSGDRLEQSGKEDYERSPIQDIEIKCVLKNALCQNTDDQRLFMCGIDQSWYYEGLYLYRAEEL